MKFDCIQKMEHSVYYFFEDCFPKHLCKIYITVFVYYPSVVIISNLSHFYCFRKKCPLRRKMYESSCSYQSALELKRSTTAAYSLGIKSEEFGSASDWPAYRFCNPSTFEQLKQSVEKAKAALQVRIYFQIN